MQTWTHGHISTAAEPEDAGRCWCPQMSVAAPGPLPWLLCSCQSVRPALFRAWQLEPLLRMPSAGGHSPGGGALGQRGLVQKCESPASSPEKVQTQRCGFDSRTSSYDQAEAGALLKITPSLSSLLPPPVSSTPPPVSLGNPSFTYCGPES